MWPRQHPAGRSHDKLLGIMQILQYNCAYTSVYTVHTHTSKTKPNANHLKAHKFNVMWRKQNFKEQRMAVGGASCLELNYSYLCWYINPYFNSIGFTALHPPPRLCPTLHSWPSFFRYPHVEDCVCGLRASLAHLSPPAHLPSSPDPPRIRPGAHHPRLDD